MIRSGKGPQAGHVELRMAGAAVGRFMGDLQTVAAGIEALGYIVYDNPDAADILCESREALAGLVGLARDAMCRSVVERPEPEELEDESITGRRRRPVRGRAEVGSGSVGV